MDKQEMDRLIDTNHPYNLKLVETTVLYQIHALYRTVMVNGALAANFITLGRVELARKQYRKVLEYLFKADVIFEHTNNFTARAFLKLGMGHVYIQINELQKAQDCVVDANLLSSSIDDKQVQNDVLSSSNKVLQAIRQARQH